MASNFLKRKAEEQAKKIEKRHGVGAYGGTAWREQKTEKTTPSGKSSSTNSRGAEKDTTKGKASSFLREKAKAQARKIDQKYGDVAYGGTAWRDGTVNQKLYSYAVEYLADKGVKGASGIMTENEWRRTKKGGTYQNYLDSVISKHESGTAVTQATSPVLSNEAQIESLMNELSQKKIKYTDEYWQHVHDETVARFREEGQWDSIKIENRAWAAVDEERRLWEKEKEEIEKEIRRLSGVRDATWGDVFFRSYERGYLSSQAGDASFDKMMGAENDADELAKILQSDKYMFEADGGLKEGIAGALEMVGQQMYHLSKPETAAKVLAATTTAAGTAAVLGQSGPQIAFPEEILTVPGAGLFGFKVGMTAAAAENALRVEAGHAYNEMIEHGISHETAQKIALGVGTVNAALEMAQVDELIDAFKILNKSIDTGTVAQKILRELLDRGVDVTVETGQEVAQEGVTMLGVEHAHKIDKGEGLYSKEDVAERLDDTANSSFLAFGAMNIPATASNIAMSSYAKKANAVTAQNEYADTIIKDQEALDALIASGKESGGKSAKIANEIEIAQKNGREVTRSQVKKLIESNEVYKEAEEKAALTTLGQAAREAVERKNQVDGYTLLENRKRGKVDATALDVLTENGVEITAGEVRKVTGFGAEGAKLVANYSNTEGATFSKIMEEVKLSYLTGFEHPDLNIKKGKDTFISPAQENAFTAGQMDRKMDDIAAQERFKNAVVNMESGFLAENLPSDVTETQVGILNQMAEGLGVKSYVVKGLKGNAEYKRQTGEVPIDFDFEREIGTEDNRQKVSIVFHAAHEMALHRVVDLAPEEGSAFVYAMYNHLAGNEASIITLADEKRNAYAAQDVEISLAQAMEEVSANNILYLYNNDEARFRDAIDRIINGTDEKAKQGLKKYIDFLKNIIKKIGDFLTGKSGKEKAEGQAELDEITKLRDMFETAFAKAVENKKAIEARNAETKASKNLEIKTEEDYNDNVSHSLKDKYWRTDLNKTQFKELEESLRRIDNHEPKRIADTVGCWYKGRIGGEALFAIYSTETPEKPTILYERKDEGGSFELDILLNLMEEIENGESVDGKSAYVNWVSRGGWMQKVNGSQNNIAGLGAGTNNQNAGVLPGQSKRNGSRAFWNVVENLFRESEKKTYSLKDSEGPAFKAAQTKQSVETQKNTAIGAGVSYSLSSTKRERLEKTILGISNANIKKVAGNKGIRIFTDQFSVNKAIYSTKGRTAREVNARIKAIPDFEAILRQSTFSHTDTDIVGLDNAAKKNVIAMHYFETVYNGFDVEIVVRDKGKKQFLYEVKFIENKKSPQQSMPTDVDSPAPKGDVENNIRISQTSNFVKKDFSLKKENSSNVLEKQAATEYNKNTSYSLKNWRTDLNATQFKQVEAWLCQIDNHEPKRIADTDACWYKGRINGDDLFVIYSTATASNPTIMYERKGEKGKLELDILMRTAEVIESGRSAVEKQRTFNEILSGDWVQEEHNMAHNNDRFGGRNGHTGDAPILQGKSSKFIGSRAFRNVLEDIFKKAEGKSYSLKASDVAQYTEQEYRKFGWARANNILNEGQNADYRSKFADAKAGRAKFNKSKHGEYIIPVSDIYNSSLEGIDNILVFAKGTIANPVITSVIEIYEYDETNLDKVRRNICELERRGIQQKAEGIIRRYYANDSELMHYREYLESSRNYNGERLGAGDSRETSGYNVITDYSLKGTNNTTSDGARKMGVSERLAKYAEDGVIPTEVYEELIEKYGAIPTGEKARRDVQVPKKTADNKKVSQTVRTILEAKATPDEALPTIEKMVEDGVFSYDAYTDKKAIKDAEEHLKGNGWAQSFTEWMRDVEKGVVSKQHTVMGWALYNNAVNRATTTTSETERKTAMETALSVLDGMVRHQRSAAQALQATRVLKKLSPEVQLYSVQKSVQAFQKELIEKYKNKAPDLKINEELAEQFLHAKTEDERLEVETEIYKDIGRQMPSRFMDKWNAWRYVSMLANLRTHIRNIEGNAFFAPVVLTKNLTATAIESLVSRHYAKKGKTMLRGKSLVLWSEKDKALLKAAWEDHDNVADIISGEGKYGDYSVKNKAIEEGREIFKLKSLEWVRKKNSDLLNKEDMWFSKPHYAYALAQYCKANNISAEQIERGMAMAPAREYAIKEAQKATYRDTNAFSQMISDLGRNHRTEKNLAKKAVGIAAEGTLPFRKTPANILVRGVEYSPIGLLKGLTYDIRQVQKGKMEAYEAIDNISAGLTGTGLLALGVLLAAQGLVRGHGEEEKEEKEFKELMGHQSYALELPNGTSVTLDWLAPEALPFFVGVNIWEATKGSKGKADFSTVLQSVTNISEPMLEMSCLQGLNDLFEGIGYASSNDTSGLVAVISSAATSYLAQGIPTFFGQAERTGEDNRMTTYTGKNDFLTSDMQYALGRASARIPFWDYHQIPYIDAWGRKEASGTALKRGFNNFLNPAYTSTVESSKMEKELLRLYEKTGEKSVFPQRADKYFTVNGTRKDLTAEEYVRYATLKGEKSYKAVTSLVNSSAYKKLTDKEKVSAIEEAYDYANQKAKKAISNSYKTEGWTSTADEFGTNVGSYLSFRSEVSNTRKENGDKISKREVADIVLDMAQNDTDAWKMYLSIYDSNNDIYAYNEGVAGKTYMGFLASLNEVDEPTKSGKYGTYTQEETAMAIQKMTGLSQRDKAALWQSVNTSWKEKNNPFKSF